MQCLNPVSLPAASAQGAHPAAECLLSCRLMTCPKLEGFSDDWKARLNQAYLNDAKANLRSNHIKPVEKLLKQMVLHAARLRNNMSGEKGSASEASATKPRRHSRPDQRARGAGSSSSTVETCMHCKRDAHRCACNTLRCAPVPVQSEPCEHPGSLCPGWSPAAECLLSCRLMTCPELEGYSDPEKARLNQAYLNDAKGNLRSVHIKQQKRC